MADKLLLPDAEIDAEERRFPPERYLCSRRVPVLLIARPSLQAYPATIHDFCRQGVGVLIARFFAPGTLLAIEMHSARAGISCVLSATVQHASPQKGGKWLLGCMLSRRLTDNEVVALL